MHKYIGTIQPYVTKTEYVSDLLFLLVTSTTKRIVESNIDNRSDQNSRDVVELEFVVVFGRSDNTTSVSAFKQRKKNKSKYTESSHAESSSSRTS